jgi:hypothetical protein
MDMATVTDITRTLTIAEVADVTEPHLHGEPRLNGQASRRRRWGAS